MNGLPIPLEIIQKESEIPSKIVAIGKTDKDKAFVFLERWAIEKEPTTVIYQEIENELSRRKSK